MEQLHQESRNWLSSIDLWRIELEFFQRMLDRVAMRLRSEDDKKRISHFQNLIVYFGGELLDQVEHDVFKHERQLGYQLEHPASIEEQYYRQMHKRYGDAVRAFDQDFREYKKDFYRFVGRFL